MSANDRDYASLGDMVQAIRLIQEFITDLSHDEYLNSRRDQMAVERGLKIKIKPAWNNISADVKISQLQSPLRSLIQ